MNLMPYIRLARLDKPWGIVLLGSPTLVALLVSMKTLDYKLLSVFSIGIVLSRSAGCVINDYADQWLDGDVERTKKRPLVSGELTGKQALCFFLALLLGQSILLFWLNVQARLCAVVCVGLMMLYPYSKRYIYAPQLFLGVVFSMGVPMAFLATNQPLDITFWLIFLTNLYWVFYYDTLYAMADLEDDKQKNVYSSAKLLESHIQLFTKISIALLTVCWLILSIYLQVNLMYFLILLMMCYCLYCQHGLVMKKDYFEAFLSNQHIALLTVCMVLVGLIHRV